MSATPQTPSKRDVLRQTHIHQTKTRHDLLLGTPTHPHGITGRPIRRQHPRGTPRVHKELVHILKALKPMRAAAPAQHVHIKPVRLGEEHVGLVADEGEPFEKPDAHGAVGDDLGQRQRAGLDVHAPLDHLEVGRDAAQVVVGRAVGQVAQAEGLADLAGGEELFEL